MSKYKVVRTLRLASACLALTSGGMATRLAAQNEAAQDYDLPAQDLGETLKAIARASGREILFGSDAVRGRKAPAVKGRFRLDEAIRNALADSPLSLEYRAGAVLIRQRTTSDTGALPQASEDRAITVTGTRIRGVGSASPVTVTTRRQLEESGINDLAEFTRILPQNYTGGQNRAIAGGGEQGGQQNLNNSATLNLRGLGPDATLTLLNGHRLSYDALDQGIDISAIPLAAIERVEVVADGASALYGSDAVAGVANIILRRDFEGVETMARVGASTAGGDVQQEYSLVGGHRWASGGFMLALDENSASPIYAAQRDYTRTVSPSLTLTDQNGQISGVVSAHQQIARGVSLELDANAMNRVARIQNPFLPDASVFVSGIISHSHVRSFALTPTLRVEFGKWQAALNATRAVSRTLLDASNYSNGVPRIGRPLYEDRLSGIEASAEGPVLALPGGDARLAIGSGLRRVSLHDHAVVIVGGQTITTANFTQTRDVQFVYGELSLPLVGPELHLPLIERLRLTGALRYEHWNGIAAVTTPKLGVAYQPRSDVTVLGTWGRSFKIPTLLQVNDVEEGDLLPAFYFTPPPQPTGAPVLLLSGSAPGLKPEHATTWSTTIELRPRILPALDLQATYFNIDYRNRIAEPLPSVLTALYNPLYSDLIVYNPSAAQVNSLVATLPGGLFNETGAPFDASQVGAVIDASIRNTARQRIHGVDFNADYRFDLGANGRLLLTGAASYLHSSQQLAASQPAVQMAGTIFNPPHWRGRAGALWDKKKFGLSAFIDYVGSAIDDRFGAPLAVRSFVTVDLNASVRTGRAPGLLRNLELRLSALNLLNEKPAVIRTGTLGGAPYDSTNQSAVGRFVGASIRKLW